MNQLARPAICDGAVRSFRPAPSFMGTGGGGKWSEWRPIAVTCGASGLAGGASGQPAQ